MGIVYRVAYQVHTKNKSLKVFFRKLKLFEVVLHFFVVVFSRFQQVFVVVFHQFFVIFVVVLQWFLVSSCFWTSKVCSCSFLVVFVVVLQQFGSRLQSFLVVFSQVYSFQQFCSHFVVVLQLFIVVFNCFFQLFYTVFSWFLQSFAVVFQWIFESFLVDFVELFYTRSSWFLQSFCSRVYIVVSNCLQSFEVELQSL